LVGVVTLPSGFFYDEAMEGLEGEDLWDKERWVRFSVANVDDEQVEKVCKRLEES